MRCQTAAVHSDVERLFRRDLSSPATHACKKKVKLFVKSSLTHSKLALFTGIRGSHDRIVLPFGWVTSTSLSETLVVANTDIWRRPVASILEKTVKLVVLHYQNVFWRKSALERAIFILLMRPLSDGRLGDSLRTSANMDRSKQQS